MGTARKGTRRATPIDTTASAQFHRRMGGKDGKTREGEAKARIAQGGEGEHRGRLRRTGGTRGPPTPHDDRMGGLGGDDCRRSTRGRGSAEGGGRYAPAGGRPSKHIKVGVYHRHFKRLRNGGMRGVPM